jgi:hypothetical protein
MAIAPLHHRLDQWDSAVNVASHNSNACGNMNGGFYLKRKDEGPMQAIAQILLMSRWGL